MNISEAMQKYCGVYEHYKGGRYVVFAIADFTEGRFEYNGIESDTLLAIYRRAGNEDGIIWARPFDMLFECVEYNGHEVPRFRRIDGGDTQEIP